MPCFLRVNSRVTSWTLLDILAAVNCTTSLPHSSQAIRYYRPRRLLYLDVVATAKQIHADGVPVEMVKVDKLVSAKHRKGQ